MNYYYTAENAKFNTWILLWTVAPTDFRFKTQALIYYNLKQAYWRSMLKEKKTTIYTTHSTVL